MSKRKVTQKKMTAFISPKADKAKLNEDSEDEPKGSSAVEELEVPPPNKARPTKRTGAIKTAKAKVDQHENDTTDEEVEAPPTKRGRAAKKPAANKKREVFAQVNTARDESNENGENAKAINDATFVLDARENNAMDEEVEAPTAKRGKPARKPAANKNKESEKANDGEVLDEPDNGAMDEEVEAPPPKRGKAARKPVANKNVENAKANDDDVIDEQKNDAMDEEVEEPPVAKRGKAARKPVLKKNGENSKASDDEVLDEQENNEAVEQPPPRRERAAKMLATKKNAESAVASDGDEETPPNKRKRTAKKPAAKVNGVKPKGKRGKDASGASDEEDGASPPKKQRAAKKPEVRGEAGPMNQTYTDYKKMDLSCNKKSQDGRDWNFKISSWNVVSLSALAKKNGLEFFTREQPDVMCFQETKCNEKNVPEEAKFEGYHRYFVSGDKPGYAGVALYSKLKPLSVKLGLGDPNHDNEGRIITAEYEKFYLVTTYVPNSGQGLKTLDKRLKWNKVFDQFVAELDKLKPVIICGDMNVAHHPIDLKNPGSNSKSAGFTQEERDGFTDLLKLGFVDTFRKLNPDIEGVYTYWNYIGNARSRNAGWRIDYYLISERLMNCVCDSVCRAQVYGSDHCPITLFLAL